MGIKKHIPNTITCCNLISGCMATIYACSCYFEMALWAIIAGAVFDFFDGMSARLLHVSSPIGKELDSLADVVTFGVAPSMVLCMWTGTLLFGHTLPMYVMFAPLLMAAFSALRLAKFNLDERQHDSFLGLPTPASAMICGSLAYYVYNEPFTILAEWCGTVWFLWCALRHPSSASSSRCG